MRARIVRRWVTSGLAGLGLGAGVCGGGCSSEVLVGEEMQAAGTATPGSADGGPQADESCTPTACLGKFFACGDCLDNDGDGSIDMRDPDCLGPCHNAEDTFFGSIPGQNRAPCAQDCYFDQDSGGGNDGCGWSHQCDPLSVAPSYPPEGPQCEFDPSTRVSDATCDELGREQSVDCLDFCLPLTPNGCDCFGCCSIPGAPTPVWLGSVDTFGAPTCNRSTLGDPEQCRPCTQVDSCLNPCDECELCVGKTEVPSACPVDPPGSFCAAPDCPRDQQPCGVDCLALCPAGHSCITGCCVQVPQ